MRDLLIKALLDTKGDPGERLPSVRQLSSQWGVAMGTVSKVLGTLRDQGHICSVPSKGYFWGTSVIPVTIPLPRALPIEILDQRFREDWKKGYFDPGKVFPVLKNSALVIEFPDPYCVNFCNNNKPGDSRTCRTKTILLPFFSRYSHSPGRSSSNYPLQQVWFSSLGKRQGNGIFKKCIPFSS
jgi:DNA-binding transcriptional MocR family regulator